MKKILTLFAVLLMAVTSLFAAENATYGLKIEYIDYYDIQHEKWTSERLAEYCEVILSQDALNKWKDVGKGTNVIINSFKSDFFYLKGFRVGSTNYYGDTSFFQEVNEETVNGFGNMEVYIVVDALRMFPVATTSSSTYGTAKADRGSTSFELPLITMDFWDNRFDPNKWNIYYKATPTNAGKFVGWVPETWITKYKSVSEAMSAMGYVKGQAEGAGYTDDLEYLILKKFEEPEFTIGVDEFEEFANICGVITGKYYQELRMRAVFEEKPTATVTASGSYGDIYSSTHTASCTSLSCRSMTFTVNKKDNITLNVNNIDDGWEFDYWTKNGSNAGTSRPWTFQVTADVTVTAVFKQKVVTPTYYKVFVTSPHGTVYDHNGESLSTYMGDPCFYAEGTLSLDVKDIDDGWEFDHWEVDGVNKGSNLPLSLTPTEDNIIVTAVYKEEEVVPPTPTLDSYVVVAQRKTNTNWFYMTSDLGTSSTKHYMAVDAGTADITKVNTSNLDDKYYWQIEDNKYLKNGPDYSCWTSGNSAKFGTAIELTITQTDDYYTFTFEESTGTRYLALNGQTGNDFFAYYKGTNQIYKLHLIKKGEVATGIDNTVIENKAVKTIENGMIIIEKAGVRYNVLGQIVR